MTMTIYGHTLPCESQQHYDARRRKLARIERATGKQSDAVFEWLYAGAPVRGY